MGQSLMNRKLDLARKIHAARWDKGMNPISAYRMASKFTLAELTADAEELGILPQHPRPVHVDTNKLMMEAVNLVYYLGLKCKEISCERNYQ